MINGSFNFWIRSNSDGYMRIMNFSQSRREACLFVARKFLLFYFGGSHTDTQATAAMTKIVPCTRAILIVWVNPFAFPGNEVCKGKPPPPSVLFSVPDAVGTASLASPASTNTIIPYSSAIRSPPTVNVLASLCIVGILIVVLVPTSTPLLPRVSTSHLYHQ